MVYPSLKKMGKARTRREGNYASSNCPPRTDVTNLELGLTLLPGSQTKRRDSTIFKQVASNDRRAHGKSDLNQVQDDWPPIGHINEPRSRFTSPYIARESQQGSQTPISFAAARQFDEENDAVNRGALPRNNFFAARASNAVINIVSCRRLSSPSLLTGLENIRTGEIENEGHKGNDGSQSYSSLIRQSKWRKVEHRGCANHNARSYISRTFQTRENSSNLGTFQVLGRLDICKDVHHNDVDVPSLHNSAVHRPRPCQYRGGKLQPRTLSAGSGNERVEIEGLGQNDVVKTRSQSCNHWRGRYPKARGWSIVNEGEGLEVEINDRSDGLLSPSSPSSRECERYMIDNYNGSSHPEPDRGQGEKLTYSIEAVPDGMEVFASRLRGEREITPPVSPRGHWRCSNNSTNSTNSAWKESLLKSISPKRPDVFDSRLPGISSHLMLNFERRNERTLVLNSNFDDENLLLSSSPTSSSPSLSSLSSSSSSPSLHHILSAPKVPFKSTFQRRASISTTSVQNSYGFSILAGSRKRSASLPGICLIQHSAAMDYEGYALDGVTNATNIRSHPENITARVLGFFDTFPLEDAVHQNNPMDVLYAQSVDEVKRLKARVQELERANSTLSENAKRCNWEIHEIRMQSERHYRQVFENLQSKTKELEHQKAETQLWRHRTERLDALSRQSGPKRSSAAAVFETMSRFSAEGNFISQPILPSKGPVIAGATETNTDVQFTPDAPSFLLSPEAVSQAPAAPIQARVVADSTGTSTATAIDLTIDGSPGTSSILSVSPAFFSSGSSSKAGGLDSLEELRQRVKHNAGWMGEAHPWKRVKRPAACGPDMEYATKRIRLDTAVSAQSASAATEEAAKTAAEKKSVQGQVHRTKVKAKEMQREEEQEQREREREAKLQDNKRMQDLAAGEMTKERAKRERMLAVEGRARKREEQQLRLRIQEEALEAPPSDEDSLADLFEASDNMELFRPDEGQVDGDGEEEDDGLEAELEAAMAEQAERG